MTPTGQPRGVEFINDTPTTAGVMGAGVVGDAIYWSEQAPLTVLVRVGREHVTVPASAVRGITWTPDPYDDPYKEAKELAAAAHQVADSNPQLAQRLHNRSQAAYEAVERCAACGSPLTGDLAETARGRIHADCLQEGEELA